MVCQKDDNDDIVIEMNNISEDEPSLIFGTIVSSISFDDSKYDASFDGTASTNSISSECNDDDDKFVPNLRLMKIQKYLFISLIVCLNAAAISLCIFIYPSIYWLVPVAIPRARDILLIFWNIVYKLRYIALLIALSLIGLVIGLIFGNIIERKNIDLIIVIMIAMFVPVSAVAIMILEKDDIVDHPKRGIEIHAFAYCEKVDLVVKTLESLLENMEVSKDQYIVKLMLDGQKLGKGNDDKLLNLLKAHSDINVDPVSYPSSTYKSFKQRNTDVTVMTCMYKEKLPLILIEKDENQGKKDSIEFAERINEINDAVEEYIQGILQKNGLDEIKYVFNTDADSTFDPDCIYHLKHSLETKPELQAVCGIIRVAFKEEKAAEKGEHVRSIYLQFWNIFQYFQYYYAQLTRRTAEGTWGVVMCMPGPVQLHRKNDLFRRVLKKYVSMPNPNNLITFLNAFVGTDKRLTTLYYMIDPKAKIGLNERAFSDTKPPQKESRFTSQRMRWVLNGITNAFMVLASRNFPIYIKALVITDLYRTLFVYFRLTVSVFLIIRFWRTATEILLRLFILYSTSIIYAFIMGLREKRIFVLIMGWFLNKLFFSFLLLKIITKMLYNLGNTAWGKTQQLNPNQKKTEVKPMT